MAATSRHLVDESATVPPEKHIVSKERVANHGEVYTPQRLVDAMVDLVGHEAERIDARFLEPACGTGNFLSEILRRKLSVVRSRYKKSQVEYERYAILAISSIYGIDILEDNVLECRRRLLDLFVGYCDWLFREECVRTADFILGRNITWGDALKLTTVGENPEPIVFSEWSLIRGSLIKRRDFTFKELLSFAGTKDAPLFSDLGEEVFFPTPVAEYPPTHYLSLPDADQS